jgi:uncharacterized protein YcaQ
MLQLTWRQAAAWRVRRHRLDRRAPARDLLAVVSRLCGVQSQVMSSAELTLWARTENLDRQAIQRALWENRTLVKTWAMRGTLHLLPSSEMPLWHAALGASGRFLREASWKKYYGITLADLDQITDAIASVLDGRLITREELASEVARLTGSRAFSANIAENSWGTILRPAAFSGRLCFGPSVGQRVRFTHPKSWLAASDTADPIDPEAAAATITRRYLAAYGPVTDRDLGRWWMGVGVVKAREWIAALGDQVTPVQVEGTRAWMLSGDARKAREFGPVKSVSLLPGFDQYVIAASCHAAALMPAVPRNMVYRPQGWISPVLLVNGFMRGTWRHTVDRHGLEVAIQPFDKIPASVRRAAEQESERLAAFLGCQLSRVKF